MASYVNRLIPLKRSLKAEVFEVVRAACSGLSRLRKAERPEGLRTREFLKGSPSARFSPRSPLAVVTIDVTVGDEDRIVSLWFDYSDLKPGEPKLNLFLHTGDWGMHQKVFDAIESEVRSRFEEVFDD